MNYLNIIIILISFKGSSLQQIKFESNDLLSSNQIYLTRVQDKNIKNNFCPYKRKRLLYFIIKRALYLKC